MMNLEGSSKPLEILMVTADHLMIDRRIMQEARSLIRHGHKVTLLAGFECPRAESYVLDGVSIRRFVYDWGDSRFVPWMRRLRLNEIPKVHALAWKIWRRASGWLSLSSFEQFVLERMLEHRADVVHVHDFPMLRSGVAFAQRRRVPLVYDAHELYYAQTQLPEAVQRSYRRKERRWIRHADVAITVNPYIARLMADEYVIEPPHVIVNAAPMQPRSRQTPLRERFGFSAGTRIVLYQGWISDNRGIDKLVLAARHFAAGTVLVIVGYGDFEKSLMALVQEQSLQDKVFFYGGVESSQLHPLTCDADLGVIPYFGVDANNYYCSPNKLFEFAIAELPFLCNDLPYLSDIIARFDNGVKADLRDPVRIAAAVNQVMVDERRIQELRAGARNAKQELNWEAEERKLLALYAGLPVAAGAS